MSRVTVVNDNPEFLELVRDVLEGDRYDATCIDGDRADAMDRIRESRPDVLMIDLRMGNDGYHGWDVAQAVRRDPGMERLPVLICSADPFALREIAQDLSGSRDVKCLTKPFSIDELTDAIDSLVASAQEPDQPQYEQSA